MDKSNGMLMGVVYGDVLGAPCEFDARKAKGFDGTITSEWFFRKKNQYGFDVKHAPGQATDDSEMTIALMQAMISGYSKDRAVASYHKFVNSGTYSLGRTTRALFHGFKNPGLYDKRYGQHFSSGAKVDAAQSNGHLMRAAPFALIEDAAIRQGAARLDTMLTNPSPHALRAADVYVELLHACIKQPDAASARRLVLGRVQSEANDDMDGCFADALDSRPHRDLTTNRGWTLHSLYAALWSALHFTTVHDAVVAVIRRGGDTDTNASIAGALVGAICGATDALADPRARSNYDMILACSPTITAGKKDKMKTTPRPSEYHPKNIPALLDMVMTTAHDGPTIDASLRETEALLSKKRQRSVRGLVVAIVGSSRAGKTTLARRIQSDLHKIDAGSLCEIVAQDSFRKRASGVADVDGKTTWEHEDFTDWQALAERVDASKAGNDVVIVEGYLLCLADQLTPRVDVWVNVRSTIEQCRARRDSYPTIDNYGSRGWADSNAYVDGCVWPKHRAHMTKIPGEAIALPADSSIDERAARVIEALQKI